MKWNCKTEEIKTGSDVRIYDITDKINAAVKKSGLENGLVCVQSMHATAGIYVNENEEFLLNDFILYLNRSAPQGKRFYMHDEISERKDCPPDEPKNGHSHMMATFYSQPSVNLIFENKGLSLGKYQSVFFAEFDGPCPRKHKGKRKYKIGLLGV
ncbi:YjbQ family protein [Candidatus Pacearchaeota archaeon]|nr:YjbQ family protein [Candidatus Pacearchaeota archaeon]